MSRSLWVDPEEQTFPTLTGEIEVDVAVVGGGFSGLGAAWACAREGASVAVLEARTIAGGASGRNAGFLGSGPAMSYSDAVRAVGVEETARIWNFTVRNHALLAEVIETYGIECGYLRRGSMGLAASEEEWAAMREDASELVAVGISACVVDRASLPRPFHRLYHGGVYYGGNGEIEPGAFLRGLGSALRQSVQFYEGSPVRSLERGSEWCLRTQSGAVQAGHVVLATNAYIASILPQVPIAPIRGQVLATAPIERTLVPFPMHANHGYQYWRQTESGRLVVGGWRDLDIPAEVGVDEDLNDTIQAALEAFVVEISGSQNPPTHRWSGIMGFTPDRFPLVGAVPDYPGLSIAAGYSGHGVAMAFMCGVSAGTIALGGPSDAPGAFDPARLLG